MPTNPASLKEALKLSPLGLSVYAWFTGPDGYMHRPQGANDNHWVMCYAYV